MPESKIKQYFSKMRGGKRCPPRAPWHEIIISGIGAFFGISAVYFLGHMHDLRLDDSLFLVGSFGATAVLLYATPNSPYAQPRNVMLGHIISAICGVTAVIYLPGSELIQASTAVSLAVISMHIANAIHPPGGATALIAVIGGEQVHQLGFSYVLTPIALGALVMLIVALLINNLSPYRRYPQFWW